MTELGYLKELGVNMIRVMGVAPSKCDGDGIDVMCWSRCCALSDVCDVMYVMSDVLYQ